GILTLLLVVMGVALLYAYRAQSPAAKDMVYSDAVARIQRGEVSKIAVTGNKATVELRDGQQRFQVNLPDRDEGKFASAVDDYNRQNPSKPVELKYEQESATFGLIGSVLLSLLPVLLIGAFFIYMMRQAQGTNNQALSFGKSRARMFIGNKPTITFDDVAGVDEAKQELQEVVEFLKYPEKFSTVGARIPRGVLLVGPPGTRKTLLARAVAGEEGVPF